MVGKYIGQEVAVKWAKVGGRENLEAEVLAAQLLESHPNIARILDVFFEYPGAPGQPCVVGTVMPLYTGHTLPGQSHGGPVCMRKILEQMEGVCRAVEHLHAAGVVHNDLKEGNILLDGSGNAVVCDMGLAKCVGCVDGVGGTPPYLSLIHISEPTRPY